ncbi:MAG: flagellar biosynthesis protein FlhA [Erysipelotrichaceae bacterium]
MSKYFKGSASIVVILMVLLIIIPLPSWLLDMMFVLNLSISFIILLISMNISEALEFSIFPSLLLLTTLFRLALNISSTRLILLNNGYAGEVVKTFGDFVIRGNAFVGLVIFLIIVIVQFMVISKGSERVAEVTARFTLDAMPGKQMAIDADLSSGLIDEATARSRRSKIQREADFFGAMDGASKFVKGDAIVSIIVTLINLIGGFIVGFMNNSGGFNEIVTIYSTATVGDGLISQFPALLISVATGIVVTRSASEANLNTELVKQFLSQPRVLMMASIIICSLLLIPGFPKPQILLIAGILFALGYTQSKKMKAEEAQQEQEELAPVEEMTSEASFYRNIDNVYNLLSVEAIEMEFGYSLIPLIDEASGGSFIERIVMFRKNYALEMGMVVPSVKLKDSANLNPNQYTIRLKGEEVARGDVLVDYYLAIAAGDVSDEIDGIDTIEPAFGLAAKWISEADRIKAEIAGYTLIDPTSVIVTHMSEVIKKHIAELITRQEINNILSNLKKSNEALVNDLVPSVVTIPTLQKVLANLLSEQVSIRDMETILETLGDYATSMRDMDVLSEYVRQALKRTITSKFADARSLKVITLDTNIENMIMESVKKVDNGSYLALEPNVMQKIIQVTSQEVDKVKDLVPHSIILTSPIVRTYYKKLVDQFIPNVVVLSFNEVDNNVQIQALGNITI